MKFRSGYIHGHVLDLSPCFGFVLDVSNLNVEALQHQINNHELVNQILGPLHSRRNSLKMLRSSKLKCRYICVKEVMMCAGRKPPPPPAVDEPCPRAAVQQAGVSSTLSPLRDLGWLSERENDGRRFVCQIICCDGADREQTAVSAQMCLNVTAQLDFIVWRMILFLW